MKKTGLADSPFFSAPQMKNEATPLSEKLPIQNAHPVKSDKPKAIEKDKEASNRDTTTPRLHETMIPNNQDTMTSRYHDAMIEIVRKAVREFGKEAATHRFTVAEKKELADLIYTYKNSGIKTNENEITRIAINFILQDYKENGENSVLHKILEALNE